MSINYDHKLAAHRLRIIADMIERGELWDGYLAFEDKEEFAILERVVNPALKAAKYIVVKRLREEADLMDLR